MKKIRKALAVLLTMAMVMGLGISVFAEDSSEEAGKTPSESDKATIQVENVEAGATVTAIQIVEANYNDVGFVGYDRVEWLEGAGTDEEPLDAFLKDPLHPTSDEIAYIANQMIPYINDKSTKLGVELKQGNTPDQDGNFTYSGKVEAGYWIVLVTGTKSQKVYNPMLLGVYYKVEGSGSNDTLQEGSVSAYENWTLDSENAWAKSSDATVEKIITNVGDSGNSQGNDVAVGDTVAFQIKSTIPSYSEEYNEVKYTITDELSEGLTYTSGSLAVKVGDGRYALSISETDGTIKISESEEEKTVGTILLTKDSNGAVTGFIINFTSDFIKNHATEQVLIKYNAVLNEKAAQNFDPNTNEVTLEYSNDPSDETSVHSEKDKTYTYTFAIDSKLFGNSENSWNKTTEELIKAYKKTTTINGKEVNGYVPLQGAEFTLYKATKSTENDQTKYTINESEDRAKIVAGKKSSDDKGYLSFTGLDAGVYILKETAAPTGYSVNDQEIPVEIVANYNSDGTLSSYSITINGENTSTYTATYENNDITEITESNTVTKYYRYDGADTDGNEIWTEVTDENSASNDYLFLNTSLSELPSTGGIGTTVFTIAGCIIMIAAAGLFFASRKRAAK